MMNLPDGVELTALAMHRDNRGWLTEIFRDEWSVGIEPRQWNVSMSEQNVLRGMHIHGRHKDYLMVLHGKITVGLYDVRPRSPTYRQTAMFEMSSDRLMAVHIPIGVMHGFYCLEKTFSIYGVDAYYDPEDELGCHWADPRLGIPWPCHDPILSARDRDAGTLAELEVQFFSLNPELA
jgi:dTDP-4-dehydrorhamnose 3,5-epimerase